MASSRESLTLIMNHCSGSCTNTYLMYSNVLIKDRFKSQYWVRIKVLFNISLKNAIKQIHHSLNSGVKNKRTEYIFHESNHVMAKIFTKNTLVKWAHIM